MVDEVSGHQPFANTMMHPKKASSRPPEYPVWLAMMPRSMLCFPRRRYPKYPSILKRLSLDHFVGKAGAKFTRSTKTIVEAGQFDHRQISAASRKKSWTSKSWRRLSNWIKARSDNEEGKIWQQRSLRRRITRNFKKQRLCDSLAGPTLNEILWKRRLRKPELDTNKICRRVIFLQPEGNQRPLAIHAFCGQSDGRGSLQANHIIQNVELE